MNVRDALYQLVHEYPGGADALAPRMKLSRGTLYAMANPNSERHGWSLARFAQVMTLAADLRPLEALCDEFRGIFIELGDFYGLPPDRLLGAVSRLSREYADVIEKLHAIFRDGRANGREAKALRRETLELAQASLATYLLVKDLCDRGVEVPEQERP